MARIEDFVQDPPTSSLATPARCIAAEWPDLIAGVTIHALSRGADARGTLSELLTTRDGPIDPIVHIYQVQAEPGSVRGWVIHHHQDDRLAFTNGTMRVVLYDPRQDSPTLGRVNVFDLGAARPCLLRIPRHVVHGVQNRGEAVATFVNMPTRAYDPADPDKWRLPADHPGIPYRF